jgi:hypothetical protein
MERTSLETNEELLDWMSAEAGTAQWGLEAVARMRATVAEQERQRKEQGTSHAARIRERARGGQWNMYGPGIDTSKPWAKLDVGFEDGQRRRLPVRTHISKELLMAAIAERCEVKAEEELELVIEGVGDQGYVVSEEAKYTLRRK